MDGWTVLDRLKHDPNTRHIPVHIISVESERQRVRNCDRVSAKPVTSEALAKALTDIGIYCSPGKKPARGGRRRDSTHSIVELIGNSDVSYDCCRHRCSSAALKAKHFDCVVLDLGLPDMSGFELIEQIKQESAGKLPIIVYTGKEISRAEETELAHCRDDYNQRRALAGRPRRDNFVPAPSPGFFA